MLPRFGQIIILQSGRTALQMEAQMQNNPDTPRTAEPVKLPYEAPKLVVMGDATEMTQSGTGTNTDLATATNLS